jgi:hypothetical protein
MEVDEVDEMVRIAVEAVDSAVAEGEWVAVDRME